MGSALIAGLWALFVCKDACVYARMNTRTMRTRTHALLAHTHTRLLNSTHTNPHTNSHTHPFTHTHTHARTHGRIHTLEEEASIVGRELAHITYLCAHPFFLERPRHQCVRSGSLGPSRSLQAPSAGDRWQHLIKMLNETHSTEKMASLYM